MVHAIRTFLKVNITMRKYRRCLSGEIRETDGNCCDASLLFCTAQKIHGRIILDVFPCHGGREVFLGQGLSVTMCPLDSLKRRPEFILPLYFVGITSREYMCIGLYFVSTRIFAYTMDLRVTTGLLHEQLGSAPEKFWV